MRTSIFDIFVKWRKYNVSELVYGPGKIKLDEQWPLLPAWITNYIHDKVWDKITYPFLNFNGVTAEVKEWIRNSISHFTVHVITYPCSD